MKTPLKSIREHRKVREFPRKMNIEEVEEPKKYENYHAKPVSDPFKTIADHRKVRELPRKMNIEEVEEPETTKIYIQNPSTPAETPLDSPGYEILFRIGCSFSLLRHLAHSSPRSLLPCNWLALWWRAPLLHRTVRSSGNLFVNQSTGVCPNMSGRLHCHS